MARIKIEGAPTYPFVTTIPIRISDINYGNHVGNDSILSIVHEARMQFLGQYGYTEMNCGGVGLIMSDAGIEFKKELFYGNVIEVHIGVSNLSAVGFDIFYKIIKKEKDKAVIAALAKTGMICYNYELKKIASVPAAIKEKFEIK